MWRLTLFSLSFFAFVSLGAPKVFTQTWSNLTEEILFKVTISNQHVTSVRFSSFFLQDTMFTLVIGHVTHLNCGELFPFLPGRLRESNNLGQLTPNVTKFKRSLIWRDHATDGKLLRQVSLTLTIFKVAEWKNMSYCSYLFSFFIERVHLNTGSVICVSFGC